MKLQRRMQKHGSQPYSIMLPSTASGLAFTLFSDKLHRVWTA